MAYMDSVAFIGGPDPAVEIGFYFSAGAGGDASAVREICVYAEKNSSGTADDNEVSGIMTGGAEAEDFYGAGSPGAYMCHLAFDANPYAKLRGIAVPPIGSGTKASNTIVFSGTATAAGTKVLSILGHLVTVSISTGDTATVVGDELVAEIGKLNGPNRPPVAAANATGTVTITADGEGTCYNGGPLALESETTGSGTSVTVTGNLASGAGTYSQATALAALTTVRTPLLVSQFNDADGSTLKLDALQDNVNAKSNPQEQLWSGLVAAKSDTKANLLTWADFVDTDGARTKLIGWNGMKHHPMAAAADYAAIISATNDLALPLNGVELPHMRAPAVASRFSKADRIALLNGGVNPGKVNGAEQLVCTRYILARYDLGVLDANAIDVLDYIGDSLATAYGALGPKKLIPAGRTPRGENVITLDGVQQITEDVLLRVEFEDGWLYDVQDNVETLATTYEGGGAVKVRIPKDCLKVVSGLHNLMIEGNHQVDAA